MNIANIITGSRLVWFVIFIWAVVIDWRQLAVITFLAAWGLDAVDGFVARRLGQATGFGYIFDKAVDRTIVVAGVIILLMYQVVPDFGLLILTKDIAALPAMTAQLKSRTALPSMGKGGKVAVVGQGLAVFWLWAGLPGGLWVVMAVAAVGAVVGGRYVFRMHSVSSQSLN